MRLREEREKAGLLQDAFTGRNTQRAYEKERNAPDLRFLSDIESQGLNVGYILTANRDAPLTSDPQLLLVMGLWGRLGTENCAAIVTLAKSIAGIEDTSATLHSPQTSFTTERDA